MDTTDWKDALGKAFNMPVPDAGDNTPDEGEQAANDKGDALQQQGARRLSIVLERKGRGGKQARRLSPALSPMTRRSSRWLRSSNASWAWAAVPAAARS